MRVDPLKVLFQRPESPWNIGFEILFAFHSAQKGESSHYMEVPVDSAVLIGMKKLALIDHHEIQKAFLIMF
jgi:hypothetical protein